jgi:hypothetical protein
MQNACTYAYACMYLQDRYETCKAPTAMPVQDWYRNFFWSAMVLGGHATHGGIQTWLPYQNTPVCAGVGRPCAGVWRFSVQACACRGRKRLEAFVKLFSVQNVDLGAPLPPGNDQLGAWPWLVWWKCGKGRVCSRAVFSDCVPKTQRTAGGCICSTHDAYWEGASALGCGHSIL